MGCTRWTGVWVPVGLLLLLLSLPDVQGRQTLDGKSISSRFLAMDSDNNAHSADYASYLLGLVLPILVVAVLTCLSIPVFIIGRCCRCCGGGKPRPGLCCGHGVLPKLYSAMEIRGVKAAAAASVVALAVIMIFAYSANTDVSEGTRDAVRALTDNMRGVLADVTRIRDSLLGLSYTAGAGASLAPAVDKGRDISKLAGDTEDTIDDVDVYRALALNLSFAVPALFLLIGTVAGLCNFRACALHLVLAMIILFGVFVLWISVTVHVAVDRAMDDLCVEVNSPNNVENLRDVLGCSNSSSTAFDSLRSTQTDGRTAAVTQACVYFIGVPNGLCGSGSVSGCPSTSACSAANVFDFEAGLRAEGPPALNLTQCASNCVSPSLRNVSSLAAGAMADIRSYDALTADINGLLECAYVDRTVTSFAAGLCSKLTDGLGGIVITQIAAGVLLTLAAVTLILGQKRFLPWSRSKDAALAGGAIAGAAAGTSMKAITPGGANGDNSGGSEYSSYGV